MSADVLNQKVASSISYSGASVSVIFGLTLSDWGVIAGIITAIATLAFYAWYTIAKNRREVAEHKIKMDGLLEERRNKSLPVEVEKRK